MDAKEDEKRLFFLIGQGSLSSLHPAANKPSPPKQPADHGVNGRGQTGANRHQEGPVIQDMRKRHDTSRILCRVSSNRRLDLGGDLGGDGLVQTHRGASRCFRYDGG